MRQLLDTHAGITVGYLMAAGTFLAPIGAFAMQKPLWPSGYDWAGIAGIIVLGFAGQAFKTQGLKWEAAGPASMMRPLDLVFALTFQSTLLGEEVHPLSAAGAACILASCLGLGWWRWRLKRRRQGRGAGGKAGKKAAAGKAALLPADLQRSSEEDGAADDECGSTGVELVRLETAST